MGTSCDNTLAVYIHWPFCRSKCPYCDFNSHVAASVDHAAWRDAYRRELQFYAKILPDRRVRSVFFGGGTPSLMEPATVAQIMDDVARLWSVDSDIEITLEANPTSVEAEKFIGFRQAGVNRLSLGVQALNDADLHFLGREHNAAEARQAIDLARAHFPRFSFDLIYARRGQSCAAWESELREALTLANDHMSLYQLTIEPTTLFHTRSLRGEELTAPDDTAATMYEMTQAIMAAAGLPAYEISNHARVGHESRHNLTYWHYDDYIGIGPGAHGRYRANARMATDNHRAPDVWMRQVLADGHGQRLVESLDQTTSMREALMMGLRLVQGIPLSAWTTKFGLALSDFLPSDRLARLIEEGYIAQDFETVRATAKGLQRLNAILDYLWRE